MAQLATQKDRWAAGEYDAVVGYLYGFLYFFGSVYIWRIANVCICAGSVPFGVYMIVQVCLYNGLRSYMDVNWRINLCLECQYSPADPAADIWLLWFYQLGSDIILSRVSLLLVYLSTFAVANLYI